MKLEAAILKPRCTEIHFTNLPIKNHWIVPANKIRKAKAITKAGSRAGTCTAIHSDTVCVIG